MGLADTIRRVLAGQKSALDSPAPAWRYDVPMSAEVVLGMDADQLWRSQPYLRTVVTFMARNVAQLGLQTFRRVSETDRVRDRAHPMALLLSQPNAGTTAYELVFGLVADLALYDRAYWLLADDAKTPARFTLTRIPPPWVVAMKGGDLFGPATYAVQRPGSGQTVDLDAKDVLTFHGWDPTSLRQGSSPVEALKQILAEQIEAMSYRVQTWRRGGRVSSVLTRPFGAPQWSPEAKSQFKADWNARWTGDGPDAGGTPMLEDGMTLDKLGFSAHEDEFIPAAKLALTVVASVYHINPTMIGLLDSANYSNVREFRRMLYGDTLGPLLAQVEDRVNTFLLPRLSSDTDRYVEFNIGEKLQGSFEEQSTAMQSSTGAPWMTRNEARARLNLPAIAGGDSLVVPLNVLVGGQSSPTDSGSQNVASGQVETKARPPVTHDTKHAQVFSDFFQRQARVVKTALGVKADDSWWDAARWDKELADDMNALALLTSQDVAVKVLESLGYGAGDYDVARTENYLKAIAERIAHDVNGTTKAQLDAALASDDPAGSIANVFDVAAGSRSAQLGVTFATAMAGFGSVEAGRQVAGDKATKTWITGANPRQSHAAMNGETVSLDDLFSDGSKWPGDGPDAAGCNCAVDILIP